MEPLHQEGAPGTGERGNGSITSATFSRESRYGIPEILIRRYLEAGVSTFQGFLSRTKPFTRASREFASSSSAVVASAMS